MDDKVTYYAIVNEFSNRDQPFGVIRRVRHKGGQRDEVFSRDLTWQHTALLYSAERGDLTNDMVPISESEADNIIERIRARAASGDGDDHGNLDYGGNKDRK
jgi:hypothetical protein